MITDVIFAIAEHFGSISVLRPDNQLCKKIGDEWICKPGIQVKPDGKGFQMKWQEDIKPTDIKCN